MEILLFRHGIAEDVGPDGTDDGRRLTDKGVEKTAQAAKGLAALIERPDAIFTSPKVRARQTAEILGKALGVKPAVMASLAGDDPVAFVREAQALKHKRVLLVGHEPTLSGAAEWLCTGGRAGGFMEMKKAGCACVEVNRDGSATLLWHATPGMLAAMARE